MKKAYKIVSRNWPAYPDQSITKVVIAEGMKDAIEEVDDNCVSIELIGDVVVIEPPSKK